MKTSRNIKLTIGAVLLSAFGIVLNAKLIWVPHYRDIKCYENNYCQANCWYANMDAMTQANIDYANCTEDPVQCMNTYYAAAAAADWAYVDCMNQTIAQEEDGGHWEEE